MTIAAAGLALSVLGTGASLMAQSQQASAQKAANAQQRRDALQAAQTNYEASNTQLTQEGQSAAEKARAGQIKGAEASATAATSAGEAGVSGLSVQALLNDLSGQTLENTSNIEANYLRREDGAYYERQNIRNGTQSQLNSLPKISSPNYLGAALSVGKAYMDYRTPGGAGNTQLFPT